ncbi:MAG: hypothetical protein LBO07_03565 [Coriobacteriales bacterium]|jgi:hypothetical protein|nr:hypothetical protein [Coriobacteriales bacterium]
MASGEVITKEIQGRSIQEVDGALAGLAKQFWADVQVSSESKRYENQELDLIMYRDLQQWEVRIIVIGSGTTHSVLFCPGGVGRLTTLMGAFIAPSRHYPKLSTSSKIAVKMSNAFERMV